MLLVVMQLQGTALEQTAMLTADISNSTSTNLQYDTRLTLEKMVSMLVVSLLSSCSFFGLRYYRNTKLLVLVGLVNKQIPSLFFCCSCGFVDFVKK